jgi:hypothetical protein
MTIIDPDDGNAKPGWNAFRSKMDPGTPKLRGYTAESRNTYELQSKSQPHDGRKARSTGRTVKMTLKVKPEFKARLAAMAKARGTGMAEVLELAVARLEGDRA